MTREGGIIRVTSADGTALAGRVHGDGPPLVLVPGGLADGETTNYRLLLHHLTPHFTCVLMSTRGRGLSDAHPDRSPARLIEDVTAFVDALGGPVGLVGHSRGGAFALGSAAASRNVAAVAAWEPVVLQLHGADDLARLDRATASMRHLVDAGRRQEAARVYFTEVMQVIDAELAMVSDTGVLASRSLAIDEVLREIEQDGRPEPRDLPAPEQVPMPVLLLYGAETRPTSRSVVDALAGHLPNARTIGIDGVGILGLMSATDAIADHLVRFFTDTLGDG